MAENKSVFEQLFSVNANDHTEKRNGLTYLSWAWAWAEVKKKFPETTYKVYERETEFGLVNYFTDGRTCWVKTGVTIEGIEYIEELPIMDFKNKSIALADVTSMDVNKAIQRSLTKACARHGLGLYIYAGEDLPEEETQKNQANTMEDMKSELKKLYEIAGGKDFDKWVSDCGGVTPENYPKMKTKLLKQINDKAEKEKKA